MADRNYGQYVIHKSITRELWDGYEYFFVHTSIAPKYVKKEGAE